MREVLLDAVVTAPMEAYWTALALNASEYVQGWARILRGEAPPAPRIPLAESGSLPLGGWQLRRQLGPRGI